MKIFLSALVLSISLSSFAQQGGDSYCKLSAHPDVTKYALAQTLNYLTAQGFDFVDPNSGTKLDKTLDSLTDGPQVFEMNTFGDGTESWHKVLVVYPIKKSIVDGFGIFNNRTTVFKVSYTKVYVDGDDGLFVCTENKRLSEEVIYKVDHIEHVD